MSRDRKKLKPEGLPHQTGVMGNLSSFIKAAQGNFDSLMGNIRSIVKGHNSLVDDVADLRDFAEKGLDDTTSPDHTHDGVDPDGGGAVAHGSLTGVTAAQHHAEVTVGTGLDVAGQLVTLALSEVAAGGELGGFMDAPTVDATHSGSAHHAESHVVPVFVASGASHAAGHVPDPGAVAGTTKYLREDATFAVPPGGGGGGSNTFAFFIA